jgi:hypothetical protein
MGSKNLLLPLVMLACMVGSCASRGVLRPVEAMGVNDTSWRTERSPEEVIGALDCVRRQDARIDRFYVESPETAYAIGRGLALSHLLDDARTNISFGLQVDATQQEDGSTLVVVTPRYMTVEGRRSFGCGHGSPGRYPSYVRVESDGVEEARLLHSLHRCLGGDAPPRYSPPLLDATAGH